MSTITENVKTLQRFRVGQNVILTEQANITNDKPKITFGVVKTFATNSFGEIVVGVETFGELAGDFEPKNNRLQFIHPGNTVTKLRLISEMFDPNTPILAQSERG